MLNVLTINIMNIGLLKRRRPFHSPTNHRLIKMVSVFHEFTIFFFWVDMTIKSGLACTYTCE